MPYQVVPSAKNVGSGDCGLNGGASRSQGGALGKGEREKLPEALKPEGPVWGVGCGLWGLQAV
jgi:hypothetical protein